MVRVAMLSRWHVHAGEYATRINDEERAEVAAVWDEEPERGQGWAGELGVDFEADLDRLLGRDDIDAVAVDAPTNMHPEVMIQAARAGKHIFTEKVMATTVRECRAIADAVTRAGVKFCISFPRRGLPEVQLAGQLIAGGHLGQVTLLRIRVAHGGSDGRLAAAALLRSRRLRRRRDDRSGGPRHVHRALACWANHGRSPPPSTTSRGAPWRTTPCR